MWKTCFSLSLVPAVSKPAALDTEGGSYVLSCKWWNNSSALRKASLVLESPWLWALRSATHQCIHAPASEGDCLIEKCLWKYIWHLLNGGLIRLKAWKESRCYLCSMLMAVPFSDPVYVLQWWQVLFLKQRAALKVSTSHLYFQPLQQNSAKQHNGINVLCKTYRHLSPKKNFDSGLMGILKLSICIINGHQQNILG